MCEENRNVYNCVPPVRLTTASKRSLRQGNVFTCVCNYVHMGVGFPACITDHLTRGGLHTGGLHPGGLGIQGVCIWGVGQTPAPPPRDTWDTTKYVNNPEARILLKCILAAKVVYSSFST